MSDMEYTVVCNGEIVEGFDIADVKARLVELFKQPVEQIEKIFARQRVVIKKGLDQDRAEHFRATLANAGLVVHVEPQTGTAKPAVPPHTNDSSSSASSSAGDSRSCGLVPTGREQEFPRKEGVHANATTTAAIDANLPPHSTTVAPDVAHAQSRTLPFVFHGEGREYFNIWIVNILLTIVTLGIYSAWAKVRNKQYFYGNTELEGAHFEYTGQPKAILKGRIIAGAMFVGYSVVSELFPLVGILLFLGLLAIMPWMITRSLMFNARNSIYRNVRLRFDGALKHAYVAFALLPLLSISGFMISLPFAFAEGGRPPNASVLVLAAVVFCAVAPYAFYYQQRFFVENHSYGTSRFHFEARSKDYYILFLMLVLLFVGGVVAGSIVSAFLPFVGIPMILAAYLFTFIYFSVKAFNLRFNNSLLSRNAFAADMQLGSYTRLVVVNTLATVFTLGLFRPWAMVRTARYKTEHLRFIAEEDLDGFIAHEEAEISALGEEMGEMFDFDFGL